MFSCRQHKKYYVKEELIYFCSSSLGAVENFNTRHVDSSFFDQTTIGFHSFMGQRVGNSRDISLKDTEMDN